MNGFFTLAAGQHETLRAINEQVGAGGESSGKAGWIAVVALVLAVGLLVMRWRRGATTPKGTSDPKKLAREMRKAVGMSRREYRTLRRDAEVVAHRRNVEITDPLLLVLCPSLRRK